MTGVVTQSCYHAIKRCHECACLFVQLAAQQAPSVFDVHKEEPEAQPAIKAEPKAQEEAPSIVSKWSLVDYDNDEDENAVK